MMWLSVPLAFLIDQFVGDPQGKWHPVALLGSLISFLERFFRKIFPQREKVGGLMLVVVMVLGVFWGSELLLRTVAKLHFLFAFALATFFIWASIAIKELKRAALKISFLLNKGALSQTRNDIRILVGRDTHSLGEKEVIRATIESVAENIVDSFLAPLFYAFLGGAPLALAYRAINTLDSMIGYRNEDYLNFGWAAAKLDDLANYIPARLNLLILAFVSFFYQRPPGAVLKSGFIYGKNHPSPNSGLSEAAMAEVLGIKLGGVNYYQGLSSFHGFLGSGREELRINQIEKAVSLASTVAWVTIVGGSLVLLVAKGL